MSALDRSVMPRSSFREPTWCSIAIRRRGFLTLPVVIALASVECPLLRADSAAIPTLSPIRTIDLREPDVYEEPVVSALAISPDGQLLATAGDDHHVRLWRWSAGKPHQRLEMHQDWVRSLAFDPQGDCLASAGDDQRIHIWDHASGRIVKTLSDMDSALYTLAYSPNGQLLATAGFESKIWIYRARTGERLRTLDADVRDIRSVVFSPDSRNLASAGRDGKIRIWDAETGLLVRQIDADRQRIRALAYGPDGGRIVSAGEGPEVRVWDPQTGTRLKAFSCRPGKVFCLSFCGPTLVAAGGSENQIRVWNLETDEEELRLVGHTGSVAAMAFDPASGRLTTGGFDTSLRVWSPLERQPTNTAHRPGRPQQ